ncbi:hypothetical protein B0T11DRAFT_29722 [Plectosphaerella cucumerina]|uniref:Uncharacterized protein n=1 Tax=Plectosphaerella cucumerina TaxID=40658 RepID=A0A8K0X9U3_9PEZI|nr:hypothetical protein B0T11DRAFT_29722 [Plectosphaerella cucumerina]
MEPLNLDIGLIGLAGLSPVGRSSTRRNCTEHSRATPSLWVHCLTLKAILPAVASGITSGATILVSRDVPGVYKGYGIILAFCGTFFAFLAVHN